MFYVPSPEGLGSEAHRTLIIVFVAITLIISETIPLPAVAILILIMQVVLGVDDADGVAASFMSDAVFFIMGSLMLAVAIVNQGLDKRLALGLITFNRKQNLAYCGWTCIFFCYFIFFHW